MDCRFLSFQLLVGGESILCLDFMGKSTVSKLMGAGQDIHRRQVIFAAFL